MLVVLMAAILLLFDYNSKIARAQTHTAEMQQSLRIAQYQMVRNARMAGRGGLIRGTVDNPVAVGVRNNTPDAGNEAHIAAGDTSSPRVLPETDVLIIRGVFSTPIYHINPPAAALTLELDADEIPVSGTVTVADPVPTTGVPQDLRPLADAIDEGRLEAIVLVSPLGGSLYGVVELDPATSSTGSMPDSVTLGFNILDGTHTEAYNLLSPGGTFPQDLRSVAYLGILEEYRYYVREQFAIPEDPTSDPMHRLSQARFFPGTESPWNDNPAELRVDIADHIFDLQIALGIGADVPVKDDPPSSEDAWLFNHPEDDPADDAWNVGPIAYLRINTLARTPRRDVNYVSSPIAAIEDRVYDEPENPVGAERLERSYRRRVLQSIVELRNL
jgi:hypothetical protein